MRFLMSWWSKTYSRPLKDPLLQEYTLEELYYEYRDRIEREKAAQEAAEQKADNIEQEKIDDALAWAEAEEKAESEGKTDSNGNTWLPSEEDKAWMEKELQQAKEEFGDDFGEDINEEF
jgi:hypothetical protein